MTKKLQLKGKKKANEKKRTDTSHKANMKLLNSRLVFESSSEDKSLDMKQASGDEQSSVMSVLQCRENGKVSAINVPVSVYAYT